MVGSVGLWSDGARNIEEKWSDWQCGLGFWAWIGAISNGVIRYSRYPPFLDNWRAVYFPSIYWFEVFVARPSKIWNLKYLICFVNFYCSLPKASLVLGLNHSQRYDFDVNKKCMSIYICRTSFFINKHSQMTLFLLVFFWTGFCSILHVIRIWVSGLVIHLLKTTSVKSWEV